MRRAQLCLSCHLGSRRNLPPTASWAPGTRAAFELDAYTNKSAAALSPRSARLRTSARARLTEINLGVTGQIENEQRYLRLLQGTSLHRAALSLNCRCLRLLWLPPWLDKPRWSHARAGAGIPPGTLRLQRQYFLVLQAITETLDARLLPELIAATDALMQAGQTDAARTRAAAKALQDWIHARDDWSRRSYGAADIAALRKALLRYAAQDKASDFAMAEQVVLGVESLSYASGDHERRKAALDALYNGVASATKFDPTQFADTARTLQGQF